MTTHNDNCHVGNAPPCPVQSVLHDEKVGEHWWSGWPGAFCMKCGSSDPDELCLADECNCKCHPDYPEGDGL